MNTTETNALSLIQQALGELLQRNRDESPKTDSRMFAEVSAQKEQTEIERELSRLSRANEGLRYATEELWKRTNTVVFPPPPTSDGCSTAIESCGSQLGDAIQSEALRIESTAASLRFLAQSLAI